MSAKVLVDGGLLAFTVEAGETSYGLDHTGRYRHSEAYLANVQTATGLNQLAFSLETIRWESEKPCKGYIAIWGR